MSELVIPTSGDFEAWPKTRDVCIAVDWDGTVKDTQVPKWTRCFNRALTEIWPELAPHQGQVDAVCAEVNLTDPATAGVPRLVALKIMMGRWADMGLPVPDLSAYFKAVDAIEATGGQHSVEAYEALQGKYGYGDAPMRWSNLSDTYIEEASRHAKVFEHCPAALEGVHAQVDLVVVSASKPEAVRKDVLASGMTHLFKALCTQDFATKKGTLAGLARRYGRRVLFIGDMEHDRRAAHSAGIPLYLVRPGDEAASWQAAPPVLERFIAAQRDIPGLLYP